MCSLKIYGSAHMLYVGNCQNPNLTLTQTQVNPVVGFGTLHQHFTQSGTLLQIRQANVMQLSLTNRKKNFLRLTIFDYLRQIS